jgi:hypothetical protein
MMTRQEKLFNIRAQVAKAVSEIDHGDTYQACLALADALGAVLTFLDKEMPLKEQDIQALVRQMIAIHLEGERVKEAEPTRLKVKK